MKLDYIIKCNALIAKFMGNDSFPSVYHLRYHNDWNELMPVLKRIGDLYLPHTRNEKLWKEIVDFSLPTFNIEACYKKAVEYIEWYNEQLESHKNKKSN